MNNFSADIELDRLQNLQQYKILDTPLEQSFDDLTELASKIFSVPMVSLTLVDKDRGWIKSSIGLALTQTKRSISFCNYTIEAAQPLIIEDTLKDNRFNNNPLVIGDPKIRFYAGVPLIDADGFSLGAFCIIDRVARELSSEHINLLVSFGKHVMALFDLRLEKSKIENILVEREKQNSQLISYAEHLLNVQKIAKVGSWEMSLDENIVHCSDEMYKIFGLNKAVSNLTFNNLIEVTHLDDQARLRAAHACTLLGQKLFDIEFRVCMQNGEERFVHILAEVKPGSAMLCGTAQDITERQISINKYTQLALYDGLTGLPNRQLLLDRLSLALTHAKRYSEKGALLYIDLDNFKTLNDTLGHDMGDLLLKLVAIRLTSCVRSSDSVARMGGDEFIILLDKIGQSSEEIITKAQVVADAILKSFEAPFFLKGHTYHSTPSIGVTLFSEQVNDIETMLKRADLAMYKAKSSGKNAVSFFNPEMQELITSQVEFEKDLRNAILNNQFQLYYQPQIDDKNNVVGYEALIRWMHPDKGLLSPSEFILVAEATSLIIPIGKWVMQQACNQLSAWEATDRSHLTIAINVSDKQLRHPGFLQMVLGVIDESQANPKKLKFELTESLLIEDIEMAKDKMFQLKEIGIGFSLDDFGTGFSSLYHLKNLPLDQIKIDQSFVKNILSDSNDAAIAYSIISLGKNLGLTVIAEGVETTEQQVFLSHHGCHYFQGYLYGRPLPISEFSSH